MKGDQPSILLVGSGMRTSLENMYLRAFARNGFTGVHLFDLDPLVPSFFRRRFVNRLTLPLQHAKISQLFIAHLEKNRRAYDCIIVFKGMQFSRVVLGKGKEIAGRAQWININPDDPFNIASPGASNQNVLEAMSFYDLYCIWSISLAEKLSESGAKRVMYLPFGYDEEFHQPPSLKEPSPDLVSFVGSWDPEREYILSRLVHCNLVVYGNGWRHVRTISPLRQHIAFRDIFGGELAQVIGGSALSLNLLRPQNTGSHNMRAFEIPAMGGLMLTNRTVEQQKFFPENEACYMYGDMEELKEKIEYILTHPHEADQVRARGLELVHAHSYTGRVRQLMQELEGLVS